MEIVLALPAFFLIALLYASIGHGGASGYLAIMALMALSPEQMRPTALTLNLFVSAVGSWYFIQNGHFARKPFIQLVIFSIPMAWIGGTLTPDIQIFKWLLGITLAAALIRLLLPIKEPVTTATPNLPRMGLLGAIIGFMSGLVGVGGGIFLTPALVLLRWANLKTAAALSAPFIFVNSVAGLIGQMPSADHFIPHLPFVIVAVIGGGFIGARWGALKAHNHQLRLVLAAVLFFASLKLFIS